MALDPSIILQGRPPQLADPMQLTQNAMAIRNLGLSGQNAQLELQQRQKAQQDSETLANLYRANVGPDGTVNHQGIMQGMAAAGMGDKIPAYQQSVAAAQKEQTGAQGADFDLHKKRLDVLSNFYGSWAMRPDATATQVSQSLGQMVAQNPTLFAPDPGQPDPGAAASRELPGDPVSLHRYLVQKAMQVQDLDKQLSSAIQMAPKTEYKDTGKQFTPVDVNPLTNPNPQALAKTTTPDEDAKLKAAQEMGFTPEEGDLFGAIAQRGITLPAGLRSKAQMKATAKALIDRNPGKTTDEIADLLAQGQINFAGDKKVTTTAGGIAGKIKYAEQEINNIIPLVQEASAAVPRGEFVPWNRLKNYSAAQLSNPALKTLQSYLQTLSNAYDLLAARGGTDMAKRAHNRALFDAADSPEALQAALTAVQAEANISGQAADTAMAAPSRVTPSAAKPGARPPLSAFGSPGG